MMAIGVKSSCRQGDIMSSSNDSCQKFTGEEMVEPEVLEESGEKMSKKAAKKRAATLKKRLYRKKEREEATSSSSSLPEDESFSSNYGDVTPKSAAGRSWREAVEGKELTDVSYLVEEIVGSEVSLRGRVHNHRLVAKILESGFTVQCVVEEARVGTSMLNFVKQLSHESVVELIGLVSLPKKPLTATSQQVEIHVTKMYCLSRSLLNLPLAVVDAARSEADIEKSVKDGKPAARVLQDTRLNNRPLDLRTPANQALFRIQCHVQIAFREFLLSKGFLEIHTPKLMLAVVKEVPLLDYKGQLLVWLSLLSFISRWPYVGDMRRVFEVGPFSEAEESSS
ncbi:LOW QUALITY PROTEIN: hypothetical protein HID58_065848 [Brassica napus]|uniref:Aminoacyl-tRNA synthetase class II (D/K/N) domain-containing protein n=1 Tax=Brassica napus TaxID=3708 RepID=A0ABQ7ZEA5_BRANA|nr:LOW QUALITY PROTEIN: hypothetical protein HID58_065848 [Brassica napus]